MKAELKFGPSQDMQTGAAWLSSVRVLRRTVNSGNERNPCPVFYMSQGTARDNWEEGEDDAKSAWPLMSWAAHVVQWPVQCASMPQGGD